MSIVPPDPSVIRAHLGSANAYTPFTVREAAHYNNPNTMQIEYGIGDSAYDGSVGIISGGTSSVVSPFSAIPESASRGEFYETIQVFEEWSDLDMLQDHTDDPSMPTYGYEYDNLAQRPMPLVGPHGASGDPAAITEIPTSTTNPLRPRTVAAGYDPKRKCLTVVFRDGTYYNYYEVSALQWSNFKRARSKGRFIYTYLDSHPRGIADVAALPGAAREALYRVVRTGQIARQGVTGKQSPASKRGGRGSYRPGNLGGTGRARMKRITP